MGRIGVAPMASQQCWGVTAGQARHNSSNVGVSLRARCDTTLVIIIDCYVLLNSFGNCYLDVQLVKENISDAFT